MATETRTGRGVITTSADVLDFVHILAARAARAQVEGTEHSLGRAEGYRQAIAEALGVEAAAVDVHLLVALRPTS